MKRVYFYCRPEEGNLQEDVIALAEGLHALGVPFSASCDYWRPEPGADFLLRHDPEVRPGDCDIVVVSYTWPYWIRSDTFEEIRRPLPQGLFQPGRRYRTVYLDHHDGHRTVSWDREYRQFDLILRAKLNRRAWRPDNVRPAALALNDRILRATAGAPPFAERRRALLVNFGASHPYPHGTRDRAARSFEPGAAGILPIDRTKDDLREAPADPYAALMWRQTGRRYSPAYYERLKRVQAVACFCGELIPPAPFRAPERYLVGGNRARLQRAWYEALAGFDPRPPRAVQWDSFRFWETLAAGAVAVNLDLGHYGVDLPVLPRPGEHYVGVNLDHPGPALDLLRDEATLAGIAARGRAWALEHYAPAALARRFLEAAGFPPRAAAA